MRLVEISEGLWLDPETNKTYNKSQIWICPYGYLQIPYGTTCKNYPACEDILNINGEMYLNTGVLKENHAKGGISEISDESASTP